MALYFSSGTLQDVLKGTLVSVRIPVTTEHFFGDIGSYVEGLDSFGLSFHLNGYSAFIDSQNRYGPGAALCSSD